MAVCVGVVGNVTCCTCNSWPSTVFDITKLYSSFFRSNSLCVVCVCVLCVCVLCVCVLCVCVLCVCVFCVCV